MTVIIPIPQLRIWKLKEVKSLLQSYARGQRAKLGLSPRLSNFRAHTCNQSISITHLPILNMRSREGFRQFFPRRVTFSKSNVICNVKMQVKTHTPGLPRRLNGKESTCQFRRHGFNPCRRKIPEKGNGNPLQYSCLANPTDSGTWRATVHGVAKRQTRLSH